MGLLHTSGDGDGGAGEELVSEERELYRLMACDLLVSEVSFKLLIHIYIDKKLFDLC